MSILVFRVPTVRVHAPRMGPIARAAPRHAISIDLIAAMDDRTRALLHRRPAAHRRRLVSRTLLAADLLGLGVAYLAAALIGADGTLGTARELAVFAITLPCWMFLAKVQGLYDRDAERADHSTTDDIAGVFYLVTTGVWLLFVASRLAGRSGPGVDGLVAFWLLAVCVLPSARTIARMACRRSGAFQQNTVIVGAGDIGQLIARKFVRHPEYGANIVGFVDREPKPRRPDLPEHLAILGGPERLPEIIERLDVERVVIAFSREPVSELLELLRRLQGTSVQIDLLPRLFELIGPRVTVHTVEGVTLLGVPPTRAITGSRAIKRAIDIVGATLGLIVLAPLFAYIAIRIRLESNGPVLFRQTRLGIGMREFTALKFRTMKIDTDQSQHEAYVRETMSPLAVANGNGLYKLERRDAVTDFGRWLRSTSLDELPQLFNVLVGDMSLVGPRPCIPYEAKQFEAHHLERFSVPQGITGLWQVTARANSSYREALEMDVAYALGWSLALDLRLLLRTPLQVLHQRTSTS